VREVESLRRALTPALSGLGLDLYDLELSGSGRARTLRVLVDRPGGADLEAVTAATRALSPVLDDDPSLAGPYLLEVSSPGLERPLRRPEHFARAVGSEVSLKHRDAGGHHRLHGTLVAADDEACEIEAGDERHRIRYTEITGARTVFEWGPAARPGSGSKPGKGVAHRAQEKVRR